MGTGLIGHASFTSVTRRQISKQEGPFVSSLYTVMGTRSFRGKDLCIQTTDPLE